MSEGCIPHAVFILQGAVGLRPCDMCLCDVNRSFEVTVSDALLVVRTCIGLEAQLVCPLPADILPQASTTTIFQTSSTSTTILIGP